MDKAFNKRIKIFALILIFILFIAFIFAFKGYIEIPRSIILGPLSLNFYGLILGAALITIVELFQRKLNDKERSEFKPLIPWLIIITLISARLWHVATDFYLYKDNLAGILQLWNGGMSIIGALIGVFATLYIYGKIKKLDSISILDKLSLYLPIGQIIGRLGNFINYELFGPPTTFPWGMFVPEKYRPQQFIDSQFFHPTFLYEIIGNLLIYFILRKIEQRTGNKHKGLIFYSYLFMYSLVRFIVEFFRMDRDFFLSFSFNQLFILIIFIVSGIQIYLYTKRYSS